jgi:lysozyme family protein
MSNYQKCLDIILHHEGGYVNHPKDPGGETNLGVTKRVYDEWCVTEDLAPKDMKDLEVDDVAPIYKKNYWDRVKGDDLPTGLDLCVFDFGVNAGTGRAAKYLQRLIGTTADGGIGPNTLAKLDEYINEQENGVMDVIEQYQAERQSYYESLSTFETFGKGWTRRVEETTDTALTMNVAV